MSTYGRLFKVTTYGESHGVSIGTIIEGFPPNIKIDQEYIQAQLDRRKPGKFCTNTPRKEEDIVEIHSGIQNGISLGTPIMMLIRNKDTKPQDYSKNEFVPRPGHADLTYITKYGIKTQSGGGRSSARETAARVAAGALAESFLRQTYKTSIFAFVNSVGNCEIPTSYYESIILSNLQKESVDELGLLEIHSKPNFRYGVIFSSFTNKPYLIDFLTFTVLESFKLEQTHGNQSFKLSSENLFIEITAEISDKGVSFIITDDIESFNLNLIEYTNIRCVDIDTAVKMTLHILEAKKDKDSLGGVVTCVIQNAQRSLGEPCFDKIEAELAKAMLSIPSTRGFEIGSGFKGTKLRGSKHNDLFCKLESSIESVDINKLSMVGCNLKQLTNNSGGTLGGITTGDTIYFNVAFKPVSTIGIDQSTVTFDGENTILQNEGRHDPCVVNRAVPIVEAMAALVLMDFSLIQNSRIFK